MRTEYELFDTDSLERDKELIASIRLVADKNGATFESHYGLDYPWIIKRILKPCAEIADFGCGIGALAFYLVENGHSVWAYDRHDFRWFYDSSTIRFVHSNILDPDSSGLRMGGRIVKKFDYVIACSSLEHNPQQKDIKTILLEGMKVLKPGGKMLITTECWRETVWRPLQGAWCLGPKDIQDTFEGPIDFSQFNELYGKFTNYPEWRAKGWEFLPYGIEITNES